MNCPLCSKKLKENEEFAWDSCPQMVKFEYGKPLSHYSNDLDINQLTMIVYPYKIVTKPVWSLTKDAKQSRILKYYTPRDITNPHARRFKGLVTVPEIHPDIEEKLLRRIKGLLIFI